MSRKTSQAILILTVTFLLLVFSPLASAVPGSITILSDPAGADVYINEVYKGKTPLVVENLESGIVYTITLKKAGYRESSTRIQDLKGKDQKINMGMAKDLATVKIESIPSDANVFVDGVHKGKTPLILELPVSTYNIKVWKDKYESQIKTLRMDWQSYDKTTELNFTLDHMADFPEEDADNRQIPWLSPFASITMIITSYIAKKKSFFRDK